MTDLELNKCCRKDSPSMYLTFRDDPEEPIAINATCHNCSRLIEVHIEDCEDLLPIINKIVSAWNVLVGHEHTN